MPRAKVVANYLYGHLPTGRRQYTPLATGRSTIRGRGPSGHPQLPMLGGKARSNVAPAGREIVLRNVGTGDKSVV
jgi:hypothetical protein